jgi:branched-chain amino acid transport system substrate-binding protein
MDFEAVGRRNFLKLLGAAGAGAWLQTQAGTVWAAPSGDKNDIINLAGLGPLSGPYASVGEDTIAGGKVEAARVNSVLNKKLHYLSYDTKADVATARRIVTEAMQNKNVKFFFGAASSAVGLAVEDVTNTHHGVFITSVGADAVTGSNCKKSTFRWGLPTYGAVRETVLPLLKKDPSLKRWYAITPNYVFGQSLLANCKEVLSHNGAELVGNSFHSLDQTDFTSYILNAVAAKPDVLLILNFGSQTVTTIKEAISYGLQNRMKILTVWAGGLRQYEALGSEAIEGLYFGCQYWHGIDTPTNKAFVKLTKQQLGMVPDYSMAVGYVGIQLLSLGMKHAHSTAPSAVIEALEGLQYDGLTGKETIRSADHQVVKQYYLLKGKPKGKMKDKADYVDIISHGAAVPPLHGSHCQMKAWSS